MLGIDVQIENRVPEGYMWKMKKVKCQITGMPILLPVERESETQVIQMSQVTFDKMKEGLNELSYN